MVAPAGLRIENGSESINISSWLPDGWLRRAGTTGMGVAPTSVDIQERASGGGRHRGTRRESRSIKIPLSITAPGAAAVESELRKLARTLQDKFSQPMLYLVRSDGSEMYIPVHYAGGLDPRWGEDSDHHTYADFTLSLRSGSAYWTSSQSQTFNLSSAGVGRGLIKNTTLTKLQLSSTTTIGSFSLQNEGDVDAYPVWTIRGPASSLLIRRVVDGATLSYPHPITNGNPITIDTESKTIRDSLGNNLYPGLATAPKFFSLEHGASNVDVVMDGTDATSLVSFYFRPRYELVLA